MVCTHKGRLLSYQKKGGGEILSFATWVELEAIIVSEITDNRKNKNHIVSPVESKNREVNRS